MTTIFQNLRYSLFLLVALCCLSFYMQAQTGKNVIMLNEAPRFPGCEHSSYSISKKNKCSNERLKEYIASNLKYPEEAKNADFKPRVVKVQITVEADGTMHSPRVLNSGDRSYDKMAQGVFIKMVLDGISWTPGQFEGEGVKSPVTVPVHFTWDGRKNAFKQITDRSDVYEYVDEPPAFIPCQKAGIKDKEVRACVQETMAVFFKKNMQYPADALELGVEGEIEVEFIVGKNGILKDILLKNDLGLGTGREALRLVELMNSDDELVWIPGEEDDKRVAVLEKTVIPFRIDKTKRSKGKLASVDAAKVYISGKAGLNQSLVKELPYPKGGDINPCSQGVVDVSFKIDKVTDDITVVSMTDYNNLGKDFQSKVRSYLKGSKGQWNNGLPSLTSETIYKLSIPFAAKGKACNSGTDSYTDVVFNAMDAARSVSAKKNVDDHLAILDQAVRNYPSDNKLRFLQGIALYQCNRKVEACVNLSFVKQKNKNIAVPFSCD